MRRIGVLTSDFALYHDLVRRLRDLHVPFTSLSFGERPLPGVGVVVTSWRDSVGEGLPENVPVVVVPVDAQGKEDVDHAIAQAQRVLEGVEGYTDVAVGIDPGHRPGIALLADGRILQATQVYRVRDVAPLVTSLLQQYPHERGVVRIGHQAPRERDRIVSDLWKLREEGVRLEMVNETGTTPPTGRADYPPDIAAAVAIARAKGRELVKLPRPGLRPGQLREVQRSSRIQSGGQHTLSREGAHRVLRGEKTIAEALEEELAKAEELRRRHERAERRPKR